MAGEAEQPNVNERERERGMKREGDRMREN